MRKKRSQIKMGIDQFIIGFLITLATFFSIMELASEVMG